MGDADEEVFVEQASSVKLMEELCFEPPIREYVIARQVRFLSEGMAVCRLTDIESFTPESSNCSFEEGTPGHGFLGFPSWEAIEEAVCRGPRLCQAGRPL